MLRTAIPSTFERLRPLFDGVLAAGGGFTQESGEQILATGLADYVVIGKLFTSNPDLPERFARRAELVEPNPDTAYSPGPEGYTDYPSLQNVPQA